jgi:hypothetical protein
MSTSEQLNPFELEAIQLIATARDFADKLEAMMVTVFESKTPAPPIIPKFDHSFNYHLNIVQLAHPNSEVTWDRSPSSIAEMRNYAFMKINAKSNGTVGFQYLTARAPKTNFMSKMDQKVYNQLEVGKIFILHTIKKSGKNYWDAAITLNIDDTTILSRAKMLSRFYGELMELGQI